MPQQTNLSLIRGFACLQAVIAAGEAIGPRAIGRELDMDHTKVSRLLGTLADMGMVERSEQGKYRPGPGIHALAAQSLRASRLLPLCLPHLQDLHASGHAVSLGVPWRGQVCHLFHEQQGHSLTEALLDDRLRPLTSTAVGIALVAAGTIDLPGDAPPDFRTAVAQARQRGWAEQRFAPDIRSVAVAFPPAIGAAIAASRPGIGAREATAISRHLRAAVDAISANWQ